MKAKHLMLFSAAAALSQLFASCSSEPLAMTQKEEYTRSFIQTFGLIDPKQDWSLAQSASVTVNLGDRPAASVKVYTKVGAKYYLVADLHNVSGEFKVPVDVPEGSQDLKVKVDGNVYLARIGERVNATNRVAMSRAEGDRAVPVNNGDTGGYWEMNAQDAIRFLDNLQEMHYNRNSTSVYTDFLFRGTGEQIVVYPIFYNSSQTHTLGLYYFDTDDEDQENVSTLKKIPLYTDKESTNPTGPQHLRMQNFEEIEGLKINNLYVSAGGSGSYHLGWGTSASTYTLGTESLGKVETYEVRFTDGSPATARANSEGKAPEWLIAAINSYLSVNSISTFNTNDMLDPGHPIYSAISQAANTAVGAGLYTIDTPQNWSDTGFIMFNLNRAALSQGDAPAALFGVITDYMDSKGWTDYSHLSYDDADLVVAINDYLAPFSTLTSITASSRLSAELAINTSGPLNIDAPGDVYQCILDAVAAASATDYDGITMTPSLKADIEAALKSANGANYRFGAWTANGDEATLDYTYTGSLNVADGTGYEHDMKAYIASYINSGKTFLELEHDRTFLTGLQTELHNYYPDANYYATMPVNVYVAGDVATASAEIRVFEYKDDWIGVKSAIGTTGMRVYKDGSIAQENKEFSNGNTAYNLSYLGKLRSYGISITVPEGMRFGFYIETSGGSIYYSEVKGNMDRVVNQGGTIPEWATEEDYIYGAAYEETIAGIVDNNGSPVTEKITYLCFEDWATGSKDEAGRVESDADLNDLVVAVSGLDLERQIIDKSQTSTSTSSSSEELSWLIAAEDLGSTDDFDFNDVIFNVSCITTNDTSTTETDPGNGGAVTTATTLTLTKKLTVKALAAGGTLETYLHFNDGTTDYILGPNKIVENNGADVSDCEWHKWFNGANSRSMINTGSAVVATPATCTIAEASGESTSNTGTPSTPSLTITEGSKVSLDYLRTFSMEKYFNRAGAQKMIEGFYITIGTSAPGSSVNSDINDDDERMINPADIGEAPQMFLIPDIGHTGSLKGWYWPTERAHITEAYPEFKDWINDANNTDWHKPAQQPAKSTRPTNY